MAKTVNRTSKVNPRKVPRSEADVRRAFDRGCLFGNEFCAMLFLWVLADNYQKTADEIQEFLSAYERYTELIRDGTIKYNDIKYCLENEYSLRLRFSPGYRDMQGRPLNGMNEGRDRLAD